MKKILSYLIYTIALINIHFLSINCSNKENKNIPTLEKVRKNNNKNDINNSTEVQVFEAYEIFTDPIEAIPNGYVLFEKIFGDLNKDELEDCVLIIKDTDKSKIINHQYNRELDRNRRGIIILFKDNNGYTLASKNYHLFSSENEEGGVYFPPELSIEIIKNNLRINYSHGRYGYWYYTFRFNQNDFELIGYDSSSHTGPRVDSQLSINFLTNKKLELHNTNLNYDENQEDKFEETWSKIKKKPLIKLSEIIDIDELDF